MSELRSPAYWVGHLFTVIATIFGVYYAAAKGFDLALELELVKADRGTYYVAESMHKELDFNVNNMKTYIKKSENQPFVLKENIAGIDLNDYVFQASKYSESTFEIEPKLLAEVSIYYFSVGNAIKQYYGNGMQSPGNVIAVVKRETEKLEKQKTLARLASYNSALSDKVESYDISLDQPDF